ncbi:MAG: M13 family metallopeptidase [Gemmatimonadota bacterium]|nr:M13 family metallopeptidase [Gemmatimonadota bacterium]
MTTLHSWLAAASLCLLAAGCSHTTTTTATPERPDFLRANMDLTADPGVDFFQYANGGWLKRNPISPSEARWGIGNVVREELYVNLRAINEKAATSAAFPGSDEQKIGDFWIAAMDTARIEQLGVHPLDNQLALIDAIRSAHDVVDVAFAFRPLGVSTFFGGVSVDQDEKKSDEMTIHLSQDGLGLPDRDYYVNPDSGVARTRREYVAHVARTLALIGRDDASARAGAERVMAFETALAKASRKLEDLRDPQANYNRMSPAEVMSKLTPSVDWTSRLGQWGLHPANVVVGQPEFFAFVDTLLKNTPVPVLQDYLRFHLVSAYAPNLSKAFVDETFHFNAQVLSGQKTQRARWKRVLDAQDGAMGMVLGKMFVQEHFPPTEKRRYVDLVQNIRTAYAARIARLDWMSPETRRQAREKLASVDQKVGFPDKWKDYSALVVGRESYATNMMNASRWRFNDMVGKYGKSVDRTEWGMTPQTYNAYYNPSNNEIVLPAAIFMVPGMRDSLIDDAVVYGYAGASTIGHEITHGFDDQGRQFDAKGNLTDWWTADDARKFEQRALVMSRQFDAYEPLPGLHINGKASLGENIADYGGLLLGLDAFKQTAHYKEGKLIGGLTPVQRYFLGYALGWMTEQQDASLRRGLLSDVHAPAKWRVLGPLSNIPEFYEAFDIKPGQPMWRPDSARVRIW